MFNLDQLSSIHHLPALICSDRTISYGDFVAAVRQTASNLIRLGVQPGERVALLGYNSSQYVTTLLAIIHSGAIACPLATRLPDDAVKHCLEQIDCNYLVLFNGTQFSDAPDSISIIPAEELALSIQSNGQTPANFDFDQPATIFFTSGSSGKPKAVLHSFSNHYYSAEGANRNIAFGPDHRWLLSLPLYHVGGIGILFRALLGGGAIIIPEQQEDLMETALSFGATHLSLVPTQLHRILSENKELDRITGKLKAVLIGGGALPPALIEEATERKLPLFTSYGLTEMASQVTTTSVSDNPLKLQTAGKLLTHCNLKISDNDEIMVRGKTLFLGYVVGNKLQQSVDTDGWFATGDMGQLDDDGYLTVTGRKDNMFVSGGENIHPEEIEDAIRRLDNVADVVVVAVADTEYGERPIAFVRMETGHNLDGNRIAAHLRKHLAGYKVPGVFSEWPKDIESSGIKPPRAALAERAKKLVRNQT
jgi:O-succinylbenzoic acid--CoA ligase